MPSKDHNRGVVESAVIGFEPSEPVLLEAQALDQELVLPQRSYPSGPRDLSNALHPEVYRLWLVEQGSQNRRLRGHALQDRAGTPCRSSSTAKADSDPDRHHAIAHDFAQGVGFPVRSKPSDRWLRQGANHRRWACSAEVCLPEDLGGSGVRSWVIMECRFEESRIFEV